MIYFILGIIVWQIVVFVGESTKWHGEDFLTFIYTFVPSVIFAAVVFPFVFIKKIYYKYKAKKYRKRGAE